MGRKSNELFKLNDRDNDMNSLLSNTIATVKCRLPKKDTIQTAAACSNSQQPSLQPHTLQHMRIAYLSKTPRKISKLTFCYLTSPFNSCYNLSFYKKYILISRACPPSFNLIKMVKALTADGLLEKLADAEFADDVV